MNSAIQTFTLLLLTILVPSILAQYCSRRPTGCCPGRDDACHVRYKDTLCYCDAFCERTQSDCCPDFFNYCLGYEKHEKITEKPKGKHKIGSSKIYLLCYAHEKLESVLH